MTLLRILSKVPFLVAQFVGGAIGFLVAHLPVEMKAVTEKNIKLCFPELSDSERKKLVLNSLVHTGYLMFELGQVWFQPLQKNLKRIINVSGKDIMDKAASRPHGVIVVAPHLGNWEILNHYIVQDYPGVIVYSPPKQKQFEKIIRELREKSGSRLVPASAAGVRAVYKHLKQGGVVYILPDQVPGTEGGMLAPFFGVPALTMTLVSRLVKKTGAEVVAVYGKRLPFYRGFDVVFRAADSRIYSADLEVSVVGLNATVERCVRDIPEQYQWSYKRFKRRPGLDQQIYS